MDKIVGRPKKENAKDKVVHVRLDEDDFGMILDVSTDTGESYSDIMRKALRFYYRLGRIHK
jgi:uncharacterized protein (DUF4415 family)